MAGDDAVPVWVEWVLGSLMADLPFPYAALLVPDTTTLMPSLRIAGERRQSGVDRPACLVTEDMPVPIDGTLCGSVFTTGTPALVADVREQPNYQLVPECLMRSSLVVPVVRDGRSVGVIDVESPRVGGLDIGDVEQLTRVATEAAERAPMELGERRAPAA